MNAAKRAYLTGADAYESNKAAGMSAAEAMEHACRVVRREIRAFGGNLNDKPRRFVPAWVNVVIGSMCAVHGVSTLRILGKERCSHLKLIRWEIAAELRRRGLSLPIIGAALHRDHSTILHGLRAFEKRLATDELLRTRVLRTSEVRAA
jgi:chromosomal replication initiation ATPase DnaA